MVLVLAKSLGEKFVANEYRTERIPLMYNDFVIVGLASDPAGIRGSASATEALKKIRATGAPFISRGDKSGIHVAEQELWSKAGVKPEGSWYKQNEIWDKLLSLVDALEEAGTLGEEDGVPFLPDPLEKWPKPAPEENPYLWRVPWNQLLGVYSVRTKRIARITSQQ